MVIKKSFKTLRELEAALGLLKLGIFQRNIYTTRRQIRKTRLQTSVLYRVFEISKFPSTKTIFDLSLLINIHPKSIQKWFQNTRQSFKKRKKKAIPILNDNVTKYKDPNIFDVPVPILADLVELEKKNIIKTNTNENTKILISS